MSHAIEIHPPVDLAHLHDLTDGEAALTREIASLYVTTVQAYLTEIEQARAGGADTARLAHSLKGASLNLGAHGMARLAAEAECGKVDAGQVAAMRRELERVARFMAVHP
jgi:HPt (histidine-containing phosphotransfer) domain-containing protein